MPPDLLALIEGLALWRSVPTIAVVHRQAAEVAGRQGWQTPSYGTVHAVVRDLDPALVTLAHQPKRYCGAFDLVCRREDDAPNRAGPVCHRSRRRDAAPAKGIPHLFNKCPALLNRSAVTGQYLRPGASS